MKVAIIAALAAVAAAAPHGNGSIHFSDGLDASFFNSAHSASTEDTASAEAHDFAKSFGGTSDLETLEKNWLDAKIKEEHLYKELETKHEKLKLKKSDKKSHVTQDDLKKVKHYTTSKGGIEKSSSSADTSSTTEESNSVTKGKVSIGGKGSIKTQ